MVCRRNFILDSVYRAANIIHSHFPALRKVAHNLNLSSFERHSAPMNFDQNFSKSQFLKDLAKFLQTLLSSSKSSISWSYSKTFSPANLSQPQPAIIQQAVSQPQPAIIQQAVFQQQPAIIQQAVSQLQPAVIQQAVFQPQPALSQPQKNSSNAAVVPQRVASTQQRSHEK